MASLLQCLGEPEMVGDAFSLIYCNMTVYPNGNTHPLGNMTQLTKSMLQKCEAEILDYQVQ